MKLKKYIAIIIFLTISISAFNQEEWIRSYHEDENVMFQSIKEAYDYGYLLAGWFDYSFPHYNWIMKTDINGNTLWEKTIGSYEYVSAIHGISQNDEGAIFITGGTYKESSWGGGSLYSKTECMWRKVVV